MPDQPQAASDVRPPSRDIDALVRTDKLALLYHQSFPALFVSLITAALLCWTLDGHTDGQRLLAWFSLVFVTTLARLFLFLAYFRAEPKGRDLLAWERPYALTLTVSALVWGFGALVLMPADRFQEQAVAQFILIGMAGGAVSTYSAFRYLAVGAMLAVLLPSTVWLYWQGDHVQLILALGSTLFIAASLRGTQVLASALHRSFQLAHELKQARERAEIQARTDALTGLANRRAFFEAGRQLARYCERNGRPLGLLLLDVDHFKAINDRYGHQAGDEALRHLGRLLADSFRKADVCGRLGGEEFAVLLPDSPPGDCLAVAEKLRQTLQASPLRRADGDLRLQASIGVAVGGYDLETLLLQADLAMYQAKAAGRNRVVAHWQPADESAAPPVEAR